MPLGANKAAIMGVAGVSTADVVLLSTQTATSDTTLSFTSDITSTYGEYIFKYYNCNPETNNAEFTFQANASSQSGYNETITSSAFEAWHAEDDGEYGLGYNASMDLAQGTGFQPLNINVGSGANESVVGELHLFNPASTTYVKHFYGTSNKHDGSDVTGQMFVAGYINVTAAITNIQFKFSAGDFDGKIKMLGVK